jgi:hypothetical protein
MTNIIGWQFKEKELPLAKKILRADNRNYRLEKTPQPAWHKNMGYKWKPIWTVRKRRD